MNKNIKIVAYTDAEVNTDDGVCVNLQMPQTPPNDNFVGLYPEEARELGETLIAAADELHEYETPIEAAQPRVEVAPAIPHPVEDAAAEAEMYIESGVPMRIRYEKADGEIVQRDVSAYEVRPVQDRPWWRPADYIVGYDHEREGIRNFRTDRIQGIAPAPVAFRAEQV